MLNEKPYKHTLPNGKQIEVKEELLIDTLNTFPGDVISFIHLIDQASDDGRIAGVYDAIHRDACRTLDELLRVLQARLGRGKVLRAFLGDISLGISMGQIVDVVFEEPEQASGKEVAHV